MLLLLQMLQYLTAEIRPHQTLMPLLLVQLQKWHVA
jgi:hypothetical protein